MLYGPETEWKYCVVGNITKTHIDKDSVLRYGTADYTGGTKVYLCGKYWEPDRGSISVIGLNRGKKWQINRVPPYLIENVRFSRTYKPSVMKIMNNYEFWDCWWHNNPEDKAEALEFVKIWNEMYGAK